MEMKLVTRAILLAGLVKVICGQCFLNIELHQFENTYNVEIRQDLLGNDIICCCDADIFTCEYNLNQFSSTTCPFTSPCQTYFVITLAECSNIFPCPVTFITDEWSESAATTETNYKLHFSMDSPTTQSYELEIMMRDSDSGGTSFREIDTFDVTIPFESGNQEEVIAGNRGIATLTLSYDIVCIEPDTCSTSSTTEMEETATSICPIATSIAIPITTITTTDTVVHTSLTTSTTLESMTVTTTTTSTMVTLLTETAIVSTCAITNTMVIQLTETAIVSTCTPVTVSAMPSATTVTTTVTMHASPELQPEEGSTGSLSDGASLAWMSMFILFFLLTIGSVMVSVYLACVLKKKNEQKSKTNADVILVQNSAINSMDNPVYGSQENKEAEHIQNAAPSPEHYCTLDNDLYAEKSESAHHDYSECGPEESPIGDHSYDYIQTKQPAEIECSAYEVPVNAVRLK